MKLLFGNTIHHMKIIPERNIAGALQDILKSWQLDSEKFVATTTQSTYVTGFAKTVLKGTFCISRNINLKY